MLRSSFCPRSPSAACCRLPLPRTSQSECHWRPLARSKRGIASRTPASPHSRVVAFMLLESEGKDIDSNPDDELLILDRDGERRIGWFHFANPPLIAASMC